MHSPNNLKISTRVMYDEFTRQGVPVRIVDASLSMLEYIDHSGVSHFVFSTSSDKSSAAGHIISDSKLRTKCVAEEMHIPVPQDILCTTFASAQKFLDRHKCIVLKPNNCSGGRGVSTNITSNRSLRVAYDYARKNGDSVIAQQHITGSDIRLLVVAGRFQSAVERRPAQVVGDGISSVRELIRAANASNRRSDNYMTNMCRINLDSAARHLQETIESVPRRGQIIDVTGPANISLGGTAHEATHRVTTSMIRDAERISRRLELGIAGVDMIWDETTNRYALIEVNATPGIDMHDDPAWQTSSDAIKHYVAWLAHPESSMQKPGLEELSLRV